MILNCDCKNEIQDKFHGKGRRVFNQLGKTNEYRCTVCLNKKKSGVEKEVKDETKDRT